MGNIANKIGSNIILTESNSSKAVALDETNRKYTIDTITYPTINGLHCTFSNANIDADIYFNYGNGILNYQMYFNVKTASNSFTIPFANLVGDKLLPPHTLPDLSYFHINMGSFKLTGDKVIAGASRVVPTIFMNATNIVFRNTGSSTIPIGYYYLSGQYIV